VTLSRDQLDRTAEPWLYRPRQHKSAHLGHVRLIPLGPRARDILAPWLDTPSLSPFLFPTVADERPIWRTARDTPFTPATYRQAVKRAAAKAGVPDWHPHQLRHAAASRIASLAGIEVARVVLGHRHVQTTALYAQRDADAAADAMQMIG
jgi:integrase